MRSGRRRSAGATEVRRDVADLAEGTWCYEHGRSKKSQRGGVPGLMRHNSSPPKKKHDGIVTTDAFESITYWHPAYTQHHLVKTITQHLLLNFCLARRLRPNPTLIPTLTLTRTPTMWGTRGLQRRSRVRWGFPEKKWAVERPRPIKTVVIRWCCRISTALEINARNAFYLSSLLYNTLTSW